MTMTSLFAFFLLLAASVVAGKTSSPLRRRGDGAPSQQVECTPYLLSGARDKDGKGEEEEKWVCETYEEDEPSGTPLVYDFQGFNKTYFERNKIVSGKDSITISAATKWKDKRLSTRPRNTITVRPGVGVTINRGSGARRRRGRGKNNSRNLASSTTGTRTVLVVRVSTPNRTENPERSARELSSDCFGIGTPDKVHMVSRYDDCSGGLLQLKAASDTADIANGVVEVAIDIPVTGIPSYNTVENAARVATVAKVGSLSQWDFIVFTWSKHAAWHGAAAYAYIGGSVSCFSDANIHQMGVQVHELGHNLGLHHSGVEQAYDDHSCLMGNPSYADDMHAMCFNGAKSFELGWYSSNNGYKTSDPILSGDLVGAKLAALDDYLNGKTQAEHSVVLKIAVDPKVDLDDYYVMYNRKKGVNSQVVGFADEVTITKGRTGEASSLVGHLSLHGESKWELPNFGGGNIPLVVELCEIVDNPTAVEYARLNVFLNDGSPNLPTCSNVEDEKPSTLPTIAPSFPPSLTPTFSPSSRPSSSPSTLPSSSPARKPSTSPSFSPSSRPSAPPSSMLPSESPTRKPSTPPTFKPISSIPTSSPTSSGPASEPTRSSPFSSSPNSSSTSSSPPPSLMSRPTSSPITNEPKASPSSGPTSSPASSPTSGPTPSPSTSSPSSWPTWSPTTNPTSSSPTSSSPMSLPTPIPTAGPTSSPMSSPTQSPTGEGERAPSESPSLAPTLSTPPTPSPTASPTWSEPTSRPSSSSPTTEPTAKKTRFPTSAPPTPSPTRVPTTLIPTFSPAVVVTPPTPPFSCPRLSRRGKKVCQAVRGCAFSKGRCYNVGNGAICSAYNRKKNACLANGCSKFRNGICSL